MSEFSLREYLGKNSLFNSVRIRCGKGSVSLREKLLEFYKTCICKPELGGNYAKIVCSMEGPGLVGLVDMHTHLAANLAFGTELFYGSADGNPEEVFNNCNQFHGGWGIDNLNANPVRNGLVDLIKLTMGKPEWEHKRQGWPNFPAWPTYHDRLHQQMRVEWLERAWRGGLRVIVALSVNSHLLADAAQCKGPCDDLNSGDIQIAEIKKVVGGTDFMEIVYNPAELREVVQKGHLAVIIGSELDCIGNFYKHAGCLIEPDEQKIRNEINRLFRLGVRYFFPIHLTDNIFGGAAVYNPLFDVANFYQFGKWYSIDSAPAGSNIDYKHILNSDGLVDKVTSILNLVQNVNILPVVPYGHRNNRGLQYLGRVAILELMKLGVMIDIDHMSEKTIRRDKCKPDEMMNKCLSCPQFHVSESDGYYCLYSELGVLDIAEKYQYPICSGHCGLRDIPDKPNEEKKERSERSHQDNTIKRLLNLNGMVGIGLADGLKNICEVLERMEEIQRGGGDGGFALGSDCNGLEKLPAPLPPKTLLLFPDFFDAQKRKDAGMVVYSNNTGAKQDALVQCVATDKNGNKTRCWDYCLDGYAHMGLYPDMIEQMWSHGHYREKGNELIPKIDDHIKKLFNSAERLAVTWEICETRSQDIKICDIPL